MNGFHLGGGKAGVEEGVLLNIFSNRFSFTREARARAETIFEAAAMRNKTLLS
jgi:hypothetical protein